jgi:hypothetical protein
MLRPWFLISDFLWYVTPYAKDMQEVFQWSTENFFKLVRAYNLMNTSEISNKDLRIKGSFDQ